MADPQLHMQVVINIKQPSDLVGGFNQYEYYQPTNHQFNTRGKMLKTNNQILSHGL